MDCERKDCLICNTETSKKGSCRQRNILYETFCITCKREGKEKDEEIENFDDIMENEVKDTEVETKNEVMKEREGDDANDTPVLVEAEAKSIRENKEKLPNLLEGMSEENIDKN